MSNDSLALGSTYLGTSLSIARRGVSRLRKPRPTFERHCRWAQLPNLAVASRGPGCVKKKSPAFSADLINLDVTSLKSALGSRSRIAPRYPRRVDAAAPIAQMATAIVATCVQAYRSTNNHFVKYLAKRCCLIFARCIDTWPINPE